MKKNFVMITDNNLTIYIQCTLIIHLKIAYAVSLKLVARYRIAGTFGGGKAWRIGHLEVLVRKSLANVNDLLDGMRVWWVLIGE